MRVQRSCPMPERTNPALQWVETASRVANSCEAAVNSLGSPFTALTTSKHALLEAIGRLGSQRALELSTWHLVRATAKGRISRGLIPSLGLQFQDLGFGRSRPVGFDEQGDVLIQKRAALFGSQRFTARAQEEQKWAKRSESRRGWAAQKHSSTICSALVAERTHAMASSLIRRPTQSRSVVLRNASRVCAISTASSPAAPCASSSSSVMRTTISSHSFSVAGLPHPDTTRRTRGRRRTGKRSLAELHVLCHSKFWNRDRVTSLDIPAVSRVDAVQHPSGIRVGRPFRRNLDVCTALARLEE